MKRSLILSVVLLLSVYLAAQPASTGSSYLNRGLHSIGTATTTYSIGSPTSSPSSGIWTSTGSKRPGKAGTSLWGGGFYTTSAMLGSRGTVMQSQEPIGSANAPSLSSGPNRFPRDPMDPFLTPLGELPAWLIVLLAAAYVLGLRRKKNKKTNFAK